MMNSTPQIVPISDFRLHQADVLAKLGNGPVFLAQRSKAAAVLVSVEKWDETVKRLQELEWREEIRQAAKAARTSNEPDISHEDFMAELKAYHEGV
jgi:prevent-host-death family protein